MAVGVAVLVVVIVWSVIDSWRRGRIVEEWITFEWTMPEIRVTWQGFFITLLVISLFGNVWFWGEISQVNRDIHLCSGGGWPGTQWWPPRTMSQLKERIHVVVEEGKELRIERELLKSEVRDIQRRVKWAQVYEPDSRLLRLIREDLE